MAEETLVTAAHRFNRYFRVDAERGGMTTLETLQAHETLAHQIIVAEAGDEYDSGLLAKAKEAARLFYLDATRHGGLIGIPTEIAFDQLDKAIRASGGRQPTNEAHP